MTLGIACNPYAMNVPNALIRVAGERNIQVRTIDLPTVTVRFPADGFPTAQDRDGLIAIDSLAPYLLFGYPAASHAFRVLSHHAFVQNPVDNVAIADDKAATTECLSSALVPQVPTTICPLELDLALGIAANIGYPVVLKRTHGAQGRWVRRAENPAFLSAAFQELAAEGPGALMLQPEIVEFVGRSIRVVITGGRVLAATERTAVGSEWRSNIAGGGTQRPIDLGETERALAESAANAVGLGHAGIDVLRTADGPLVLEVNSCPDFTSMLPYFQSDLTQAVLSASML